MHTIHTNSRGLGCQKSIQRKRHDAYAKSVTVHLGVLLAITPLCPILGTTHDPHTTHIITNMPRDGTSFELAGGSFPLLPAGSGSASRSGSAGPSRRTSGERIRKVRLSDDLDGDVERHGEISGRSTPASLHARRSTEHGDGTVCE
jgi:hypothetical protein